MTEAGKAVIDQEGAEGGASGNDLGHTVNFKTRKHFKDKKSHYADESEWTVFLL